MIIFVEGYDCSGKTTLCNKLSKELNMPIYKTFNERKLDRNYNMTIEKKIGLKRRIDADLYISDFLLQIDKEISFISDRSLFSYMFYNKEDKNMYNWWANKLKNINGKKVLIFCLPNYDNYKLFLTKRNKKTTEKEIKYYINKNEEFLSMIKKYWKETFIIINIGELNGK